MQSVIVNSFGLRCIPLRKPYYILISYSNASFNFKETVCLCSIEQISRKYMCCLSKSHNCKFSRKKFTDKNMIVYTYNLISVLRSTFKEMQFPQRKYVYCKTESNFFAIASLIMGRLLLLFSTIAEVVFGPLWAQRKIMARMNFQLHVFADQFIKEVNKKEKIDSIKANFTTTKTVYRPILKHSYLHHQTHKHTPSIHYWQGFNMFKYQGSQN